MTFLLIEFRVVVLVVVEFLDLEFRSVAILY